MDRFAKIADRIAARKAPYHDVIFPILQQLGRTDIDSRHVEAYLRLEERTLDGWSRSKFVRLIPLVIREIDARPVEAEQLADSYGL